VGERSPADTLLLPFQVDFSTGLIGRRPGVIGWPEQAKGFALPHAEHDQQHPQPV
jgi:hypothetical protein